MLTAWKADPGTAWLPAETTVGVDAGITSLVTLSAGEKIVNRQYGPQPLPGARDFGCVLGGAAAAAGVQGGLVRADRDRGRQVLPVEHDMFSVRPDRRSNAAECPRVGVRRVWRAPRPGRERGEGSTGRRTGGFSLRRWCQTAPHVVLGGDHQ